MSIIEPAAPERIVTLPKLDWWTPERWERCKYLFVEMKYSYTQVAIDLHTTRNAVCGKLVRNGIHRGGPRMPGVRPEIDATKAAAAIRRYKQAKRKAWLELTDLQPELTPGTVTIVDLEPHHCHWPCWDIHSTERFYCGAETVPFMSYCARHCLVAYQPGRQP